MKSILEAPDKQAIESLYEITVFAKRILRIDGLSHVREHDYLYENILFTYVSVDDAIRSLQNHEVVDAILLHSHDVASEVSSLMALAREKAVPVIWYTFRYDTSGKTEALKHAVDDYHYGAITPLFMKRVEGLRKLKAYKNSRGDKPYDTFSEDAPRYHQWALKRAMDITVSLALLLLLSPFLLLIAIVIKLESRGPVLYIAKRAGSGYRIFDFYKFRTMRAGADKELKELANQNQYAGNGDESVFFKLRNDPRVTPFGALLRKTSLDELPQLLNVLLGDMSLVGNRPLPLYEAAQLTNNRIAWRFLAPAGITGLWQITKRGKDSMSSEERIALDMEYAMKRSFMLDLKILLSTLPALLQREDF